MSQQEDKKSEIEKILGEPVIDDLSESSHGVRRNLIVFSSIALFYKLGGVKIGEVVDINGVHISGISNLNVVIALKLIVIYHFLHFFMIAIGHLK